jgi:hypothetical protein
MALLDAHWQLPGQGQGLKLSFRVMFVFVLPFLLKRGHKAKFHAHGIVLMSASIHHEAEIFAGVSGL